jgi:tetratricopeptide (TPR) repeat protein
VDCLPFVLKEKNARRYTAQILREDFTTGVPAKISTAGQILLSIALMHGWALTQAVGTSAVGTSKLERGLQLAASGHCDDAFPLLKQQADAEDRQLRYKVQLAIAHCAIKRRDGQATVTALLALKHDFPNDPEVLYLTSEVFLQIAETASEDLARLAPNSYQVRRLEAEGLETQNKWAEAAAIYRKILEENPKLPEIHFRLGHAALSQPELPNSTEEAKREFEQELAIDPSNASAEFWLGEIADRDGQWDEAISRFNSAIKLDPTFSTAYLGLGMALNSAGRFSDAVAPLEHYTAAVPGDLAGHYDLATAYNRTGRKKEAAREMMLHQQLSEKKQGKPQLRTDAPIGENSTDSHQP